MVTVSDESLLGWLTSCLMTCDIMLLAASKFKKDLETQLVNND